MLFEEGQITRREALQICIMLDKNRFLRKRNLNAQYNGMDVKWKGDDRNFQKNCSSWGAYLLLHTSGGVLTAHVNTYCTSCCHVSLVVYVFRGI